MSQQSSDSSSDDSSDSEESKKEKEDLNAAFKQQQQAWKGQRDSVTSTEMVKKDMKAPLLGIQDDDVKSNHSYKSQSSAKSRSHRSHKSTYGGATRTPRKTPK